MKKLLSLILAAAVLLTCVSTAALTSAAVPAYFNQTKNAIDIRTAPTIRYINVRTDYYGTEARAYIQNSDDALLFHKDYESAGKDYNKLFAGLLGKNEKDVADAYFETEIQYAYSLDGVNWTGALKWEETPDNDMHDYDLDGDGFYEFCGLPYTGIDFSYRYDYKLLFDAEYNWFCSPTKEELTKYNNAMFSGKGEYTADESEPGLQIDFNRNTLYVKARYVIRTEYDIPSEDIRVDERTYSPWSAVKTYNNATSSPEGQDCVPSVTALGNKDKATISPVYFAKTTDEDSGITYYRYTLKIDPPASKKAELAKYYALDEEIREDITGDYYEPEYVIEFKRGNSDWYILDYIGLNNEYYDFNTDHYYTRDQLEAIGNTDVGTVSFRATLIGSYGYDREYDESNGLSKLIINDNSHIVSGTSDPVEVSVGGNFNIRYHLDGGEFPEGERAEAFGDDSTAVIDLTAPVYTPAKKNHTFGGWYSDPEMKNKVTSVDTSVRASADLYAKFTENKYYNITYSGGSVSAYFYNPNPEKIYTGEKNIVICDVEYSGAEFSGWYDAPSGGKKISSLSYASMSGDITLYAYWQLPEKTITYSGAGKNYVNDPSNPAKYPIKEDGNNSIYIYAPTRTGYIFDGWYLGYDKTSGSYDHGLYKDEEAGAYVLNESENVTLYAKWIKGRWKINYKFNTESPYNGLNPDEYTYGDTVKLEDASKTGYTFNGWYGDAAYKNRVTSVSATSEGEKTLYGKFTAIKYKITCDYREADESNYFINSNPTERTVEDETILKPLTPASPEYKFMGFFDNVNFNGAPIEKIAAGTAKDIKLYAKVRKYSWGDIDLDGAVTVSDARLVLRCAIKLDKIEPDVLPWADIHENSKACSINISDARAVLRIAIKLDTEKSLKLPELPAALA